MSKVIDPNLQINGRVNKVKPPRPSTGSIYLNPSSGKAYIFDGADWIRCPSIDSDVVDDTDEAWNRAMKGI